MRKKIILLSAVLLLLISVVVIGRVGTTNRIEKVVDISVHTNGEIIPSQITIDGMLKKTYFPSENSFEGVFAIEYLERTCRTDSKVLISWSNGQPSFAIMDSETFSLVPVNSIEIDSKMENIRIVFSDGIVIETDQ